LPVCLFASLASITRSVALIHHVIESLSTPIILQIQFTGTRTGTKQR